MKNLPTGFKEIAEHVNGDQDKGKDLMLCLLANEKACAQVCKDLLQKMDEAAAAQETYKTAIERVMTHLELKKPLAVKVVGGIWVISETSITFETNVI